MQPVQSGAGPARTAAAMGIASAALYILGIFIPYVGGGGGALTDGGDSAIYILYLLPGALAVVAGFMALQGKSEAAGFAAGAVTGLFGLTVFLLTFIYKFIDGFDVPSALASTAMPRRWRWRWWPCSRPLAPVGPLVPRRHCRSRCA